MSSLPEQCQREGENLKKAFEKLAQKQSTKNISQYEYQIKMFGNILKSSIRETIQSGSLYSF